MVKCNWKILSAHTLTTFCMVEFWKVQLEDIICTYSYDILHGRILYGRNHLWYIWDWYICKLKGIKSSIISSMIFIKDDVITCDSIWVSAIFEDYRTHVTSPLHQYLWQTTDYTLLLLMQRHSKPWVEMAPIPFPSFQ